MRDAGRTAFTLSGKMNTVFYPRLIKRVRAVLIDSVVVPIIAVAVLVIGHTAGITDLWGMGILATVAVLIMEPGLVALTGGTVGHHMVGIRVARADGAGKLDFLTATLRAIVKFVLGWLSFIFVLTTTKHQAIHDLAVNSIVVHKSVYQLPSYEVLSERRVESSQFVYPAKWKRVLLTVLYWLAISVASIAVMALLSSEDCSRLNRCATSDLIAAQAIDLVWLLSTGALIVLGWNGRLPGARRRAKVCI